jgi:transporter family-2 protein
VNNLYLLLALATGAGVAVMAVLNARLGLLLGGPLWAAAAQFTVALSSVLILTLATWSGGLFSATFIIVSILLTPRLGVALTLASIIVGQLSAALVVDHYGLFGGSVIRISPTRVLGVALLLAGVTLIRWRS